MMRVAVTRVPPDWLPSLCTASLMRAGPAHDRYIGPYCCVTKQFIVIYATINAMGKCCAHTYVHSGFCAPLFLCISASIKPSHKEVMGFSWATWEACVQTRRGLNESRGSLLPSVSGEHHPLRPHPQSGMFQSPFTWWHPPVNPGTFHISLDQSKEAL